MGRNNYKDTYAPMISPVSMRIFILEKMGQGWGITRIDVKESFLNTSLKEEIAIIIPDGYIKCILEEIKKLGIEELIRRCD